MIDTMQISEEDFDTVDNIKEPMQFSIASSISHELKVLQKSEMKSLGKIQKEM